MHWRSCAFICGLFKMKNFFLGFVIGIVFVGLVVVILGFAAVRMAATLGGERPVTVADNSALMLNLEGAVPGTGARRRRDSLPAAAAAAHRARYLEAAPPGRRRHAR